MIANSIFELIGDTPMLQIPKEVHGLDNIELYAKLELFNPWGSVKDRTAWNMIASQLDELANKSIIETSSGNTAKALQMISTMHGSNLKTITNLIKVPEVKDVLKLTGAEIQELPGQSDCYDPNDPNDPIVYVHQEMAQNPGAYINTDQFFNDRNPDIHYKMTGKEILEDLGSLDYFIGGLGTTGSTLGVTERLKENNPETTVFGVVAEKADYIPGIRNRDEIIEGGLFKPEQYDEIVSVDSKDALESMRLLIQKVGLLAGPSTGAALRAALTKLSEIDKTLTEPKKAAFIACDRAEWYMSYIKDRKPHWFGEAARADWKDGVELDASTDIAIEDVASWIEEHDPLIIDVRQPISFKTAHIPNSMNLPFDYIDSILNTTNPFRTKQKLLFTCPLGEKSGLIASYLKIKGVSAYNLKDGVNAWRDADLSLERDAHHA